MTQVKGPVRSYGIKLHIKRLTQTRGAWWCHFCLFCSIRSKVMDIYVFAPWTYNGHGRKMTHLSSWEPKSEIYILQLYMLLCHPESFISIGWQLIPQHGLELWIGAEAMFRVWLDLVTWPLKAGVNFSHITCHWMLNRYARRRLLDIRAKQVGWGRICPPPIAR